MAYRVEMQNGQSLVVHAPNETQARAHVERLIAGHAELLRSLRSRKPAPEHAEAHAAQIRRIEAEAAAITPVVSVTPAYKSATARTAEEAAAGLAYVFVPDRRQREE